MDKTGSHLSTLIERVKRMESNKDTDNAAFKGRLLNLAEYLVYYNDWTKEEVIEARAILDKYDFDVEFSHKGIEKKNVELRGLPDHYSETCMRCGRALSNPYSKKKGMGGICRQKAKQGDWGKKDNPPERGKIKYQGLLSQGGV
jgi:hypothetical protein